MGVVVTGLKIIYKNILVMEVKVQDGDIINVPHGLKPIIKDTYITFKKQPIFKNGDVLVIDSFHESGTNYIFIFNGIKERDGFYYHALIDKGGELFRDSKIVCDSSQVRHATIAEEYAFFKQLKQEKLKWNKTDYKLEYIRWRAKKKEKYYYLDSYLKVEDMTETGSWVDNDLYNSGNYFRTKDLALLYKLNVQSTLKKFHEEIKE